MIKIPTREEILKQFLNVQARLAQRRNEHQDDMELRHIKILMDRLEDEFYTHWPLLDTDKARNVGIYAGRIMLDGPHGDLAREIIDVTGQMDDYD